uniref:Immunoglobulin V-set domain-containing protein n=1 Tax=Cyprinus carpio carpio TaxID=630221 RepID=A0A8C0XSM2_CYPCA
MWTPKSQRFGDSATDGTDIHGYFGKGATIICSYSWASTNIKYFCRDPCGDNILMKSDQSPTGRYRLKDSGEGTFTVNITDLQESDSGIYWCGVDRFGFDTFTKGCTINIEMIFNAHLISKAGSVISGKSLHVRAFTWSSIYYTELLFTDKLIVVLQSNRTEPALLMRCPLNIVKSRRVTTPL